MEQEKTAFFYSMETFIKQGQGIQNLLGLMGTAPRPTLDATISREQAEAAWPGLALAP